MAGLLLITHGQLGNDMLTSATEIIGGCPLATAALAIENDCEPDDCYNQAVDLCKQLDNDAGVLVLTDLYGSTPSNIANRLIDSCNVKVVSGVSLPMLLRILNYPDMNLDALSEKAASGARDGIVITSRKQAS